MGVNELGCMLGFTVEIPDFWLGVIVGAAATLALLVIWAVRLSLKKSDTIT